MTQGWVYDIILTFSEPFLVVFSLCVCACLCVNICVFAYVPPVYSVMSKSMSLRQFFDASQRPVASCLRTKQEWRGETLRSVTDSLVDPKELADISSLEYRNTSNLPMLVIRCCFVFVLVLMRKIQLWFRLIKGLSKWLIKKGLSQF